MKSTNYLLKAAFCFLVGVLPASVKANNNGCLFDDLKPEIKNPSNDYRPAPFYVWNGKITKNEIDNLISEATSAGFGGIFIHPRPGLITEYLSKEWFDLWEYTMEKARRLGMNVWIYDENSYPSGFAGGHLPVEMPEAYNQGQGLVMTSVNTLPENADEYFICLKSEHGTCIDITGKTSQYTAQNGSYYLFEKRQYRLSEWMAGGYPYTDLLIPGVTEKFLEITMSGYEKRFGKEFGGLVKGVFTDEPEIPTPGGVRWTPDFFEQFARRRSYDPVPHLPSMFRETGNWKRFRHDWNKTLTELFVERWAKVSHDYYTDRGLEWTGHYWEHGWPDLNNGGDNMAMYPWHHVPAIDMLFNTFDDVNPQAQFGNVRAVKELSSAARQAGRKRTLSETYGGSGWDVTFKDFKRLGDWEYVLGVNFMNQHFSNYTLVGRRKIDYPPFFSYQASWYKHYKSQNDYFGRLSKLLSSGDQPNDVIVLEPNTSLWMYYSGAGSTSRLMEIGRSFQGFITRLEKNQVEYDLGSELILADRGSVSGARLTVGEVSYGTVVIPPDFENLDRTTLNLLKAFVAEGGKLVAFSIPRLVEGQESAELNEVFGNFPNVSYSAALTDGVIAREFANPAIRFEGAHNDNLYHHRRSIGDGELLFLVNSSPDTKTGGDITIDGKDVLLTDLFTGEIYRYPSVSAEGGKVKFSYELEPAGSMMLFVSQDKREGYPFYRKLDYNRRIGASSPVTARRMTDNALTLDYVDLKIGDTVYRDIATWKAADVAFRRAGFNGNPWGNSQYKTIFNDRDTMTDGGFTATYRFTVDGQFSLRGIRAAAERPDIFTFTVNGHTLSPKPGQWWIDRGFAVYEIGKCLKEGENVITLSVPRMRVYAEIEPVYIVGDFSVAPIAKGFKIAAPGRIGTGSWKEQGMPFYAGDIAYIQKFELDDLSKHYAISLDEWAGAVSEVRVNGRSAGLVIAEPNLLDVTRFLRKGSNTIEIRVTGTNKNLFGPFHTPNDKGIVGPWNFMSQPVGQPAGREYRQEDYGLTKFSLLATE